MFHGCLFLYGYFYVVPYVFVCFFTSFTFTLLFNIFKPLVYYLYFRLSLDCIRTTSRNSFVIILCFYKNFTRLTGTLKDEGEGFELVTPVTVY